ncbi:hypothetical protein C8R43DRAFT_952782 [Mycena crocata]|nr:hypothetical protein C8R43DRAFT_952782 [Mycena crocata]
MVDGPDFWAKLRPSGSIKQLIGCSRELVDVESCRRAFQRATKHLDAHENWMKDLSGVPVPAELRSCLAALRQLAERVLQPTAQAEYRRTYTWMNAEDDIAPPPLPPSFQIPPVKMWPQGTEIMARLGPPKKATDSSASEHTKKALTGRNIPGNAKKRKHQGGDVLNSVDSDRRQTPHGQPDKLSGRKRQRSTAIQNIDTSSPASLTPVTVSPSTDRKASTGGHKEAHMEHPVPGSPHSKLTSNPKAAPGSSSAGGPVRCAEDLQTPLTHHGLVDHTAVFQGFVRGWQSAQSSIDTLIQLEKLQEVISERLELEVGHFLVDLLILRRKLPKADFYSLATEPEQLDAWLQTAWASGLTCESMIAKGACQVKPWTESVGFNAYDAYAAQDTLRRGKEGRNGQE